MTTKTGKAILLYYFLTTTSNATFWEILVMRRCSGFRAVTAVSNGV